MRKIPLAVLVLVTNASLVLAQSPVTITDYSQNLSTTAINCVPGDSGRRTLMIENPSGGTNNVGYCISVPNQVPCIPSIGSAGTSVLIPGAVDYWNGSPPIGPINCIGGGATTPVTIRSGK